MKIKKSLVIVLVLMMVATYLPMNALKVEAKANVKSIKLNYSQYMLKKGKTLKLKATVKPFKYKNKVVWQSSNKRVAIVSKRGIVKGLKNGKAVITAKVRGSKKKAACKITVGIPVKTISLNKSSLDLCIGQREQLKSTLSPANATLKTVTYSSSNSKIAKISSSGLITAVGKGSAVITATTKDGGRKASCKVTVKGELSDDLLDLSKVSMKDADGKELIKDWGWHYEEYDHKYICSLVTDATKINNTLTVTAKYDGVKAIVKDSDSKDYSKMISISYAGYEKKCYVTMVSARKAYMYCGIKKISMKDANNNELIDDWYYIDDDSVNSRTIIKLQTTVSAIFNTLTITPEFGKAHVTIKDVNKGDCKKMAVISCEGRETRYYIGLSKSNSIFNLSSVSMKNSAGDELIYDWRIDDETNDELVLRLGTFSKEINKTLSVSPIHKDVVANIQDSDMNGYDKMLVLKYAGSVRKYYIELEAPGDTFDISSVSMKDASDREMVADWTTYEDYYYDEDTEDDYNIDVIQLQTIAQSVENLNVTPKYKEVSARVENSDLSGYEKMVVLKYGENEKKYYVELINSPDLFYFSNVSMKDSNGKELINNWYCDCGYDEEKDEDYDILVLESLAEELNDTLTISPKYTDIKVQISTSDKSGYAKMVNIENGNTKRTYYIDTVISESDEVFAISDVSMKKDGKELVLDWDYYDSDYCNEDDDEYEIISVLELESFATDIAELVVTPSFKDTKVDSITNSDIPGYDKKIVLKYDGNEKECYVTLRLPYDAFNIEDVSMKDSRGLEHIEDWSIYEDWYYDEKVDDFFDVLSIETLAPEINNNLKIALDYKNTTANIVDSDVTAYKKMLVLNCAGQERKYYIKLELPNGALDVGNVSMKDSKDPELVERWHTDEYYDEDYNEYYVLKLEMLTDKINDSLKITPAYKTASAVIKTSDKAEFEKMVEITCSGSMMEYYIDIDFPNRLTGIANASMKDDKGNEQVYWRPDCDVKFDGNKKYNVLYIYAYASELKDTLTIIPKNKQAIPEIMPSDDSKYKKMVVIKIGNLEKKYYISLESDV